MSGAKVLIEGVVQVPSGFSVCLYLATYLSGLMRSHPFMRSTPMISLTCSTPAYSTDILIILSSFGIIPVSFVPLPKLPHLTIEPQGLLPTAGHKSGPSFFDLLSADCSSQASGPWDPLSHLRTILDSRLCVQFECRVQGKIPLVSSFTPICLHPILHLQVSNCPSPFHSLALMGPTNLPKLWLITEMSFLTSWLSQT